MYYGFINRYLALCIQPTLGLNIVAEFFRHRYNWKRNSFLLDYCLLRKIIQWILAPFADLALEPTHFFLNNVSFFPVTRTRTWESFFFLMHTQLLILSCIQTLVIPPVIQPLMTLSCITDFNRGGILVLSRSQCTWWTSNRRSDSRSCCITLFFTCCSVSFPVLVFELSRSRPAPKYLHSASATSLDALLGVQLSLCPIISLWFSWVSSYILSGICP